MFRRNIQKENFLKSWQRRLTILSNWIILFKKSGHCRTHHISHFILHCIIVLALYMMFHSHTCMYCVMSWTVMPIVLMPHYTFIPRSWPWHSPCHCPHRARQKRLSVSLWRVWRDGIWVQPKAKIYGMPTVIGKIIWMYWCCITSRLSHWVLKRLWCQTTNSTPTLGRWQYIYFSDHFASCLGCLTGSSTAAISTLQLLPLITPMLVNSTYVCVIALDFSKAFNTVRHSTLLHKVSYGNKYVLHTYGNSWWHG